MIIFIIVQCYYSRMIRYKYIFSAWFYVLNKLSMWIFRNLLHEIGIRYPHDDIPGVVVLWSQVPGI